VLGQPARAIGTRLQDARVMLDTAGVLAWTVVALVLAGATEGLLRIAARRLSYR
jgi:ABC-type nitrate/sulfonate/bicarbonate transport system permease component